MDSLDFANLRQANVIRCTQDFHQSLSNWSVAEWGAATAGEVGEACNIAKKMIRYRDNVMADANKGVSLDSLRVKLTSEIADAVIYLDLWAASQGIDLAKAVRETFNAKSKELGVSTVLQPK